LIVHTSADFSGAYVALPVSVLAVGAVASAGSGIRISTLVALLRSLNCDLALTWYCVRLRLGRSTKHSTQMSGLRNNRRKAQQLPYKLSCSAQCSCCGQGTLRDARGGRSAALGHCQAIAGSYTTKSW
jgi:hypothetical protein